ncbi:MAG: VCBS repeat-containing protein [Planctomycetales bacterium]|nr:VCBS repeat-containing protein [Planctomycetales bacterium]
MHLPERRKPVTLHLESLDSRRVLTALVDIDGDADLDFVHGSGWSENTDGFGTFEFHHLGPGDSVVADFDGDGDTDIVKWSSQRTRLLQNDGLGNFEETHSFGSFRRLENVRVFDVGGDGDQDVILFRSGDRVGWFENLGNDERRFELHDFVEVPGVLDAADINNDGRLDFVSLQQTPDVGKEIVAHISQQGQSRQQILASSLSVVDGEYVIITQPVDAEFVDMDGDGQVEVAVELYARPFSRNILTLHSFDGDDFLPGIEIFSTIESILHLSDVDRDGMQDVIRISYVTDEVSWYRNTGAGISPGRNWVGFSWLDPEYPDLGDINSDGMIDLAVEDHRNTQAFTWQDGLSEPVRLGCSKGRVPDQQLLQSTIVGLQKGLRSPIPGIDVDRSGSFDVQDVNYFIKQCANTTFGDTNVDGVFNSSDIVEAFQAGEYEDGINGNSDWTEGDWNSDGDFTSTDIVFAFQSGNYATNARPPRQSNAIAIFGYRQEDHKSLRYRTSLVQRTLVFA